MADLITMYTEFRTKGEGRGYKRVASIPAQIVVEAIRNGVQILHLDDTLSVSLASNRVQTYVKGVVCVHCGLEGKFFAVERQHNDTKYHVNIYAIKDGREVMITSDHIKAKSKDGSNGVENRQALCEPCNKLKSNFDSIEEAIAARNAPKPLSKEAAKDVQRSLRRRVGMYDHAMKMLQSGNTDHNWSEIMRKIDNGITTLLRTAFGVTNP